jgi:rfaE bifunctional protein nucleotidyltransferase chain/domain
MKKANQHNIVWTNGVFDLLHPGHIHSLQFARQQGDLLIVGLNTDEAVKSIKGPTRPIQTYEIRKANLLQTNLVDYVIPIGIDPTNELSIIRPDILVKGQDYKTQDVLGGQYARKIMLAPLLRGYSTTNKIIDIKSLNILVIGDIMIDEYYEVKATRISPESPAVSIMMSTNSHPKTVLPGGAANVARQLPCSYTLFGIEHNRPIKKRFFDGDVQVGRWDIEQPNYGLTEEQLNEHRRQLFDWGNYKFNAVILSDYAKGVFHEHQVIPKVDVPVIVDPKKGPLKMWRGCTVIKPNAHEAHQLTGYRIPADQARAIQDEVYCQTVVITRAGQGLFILDKNEEITFEPKKRVQASNTIGAGDVFIANLTIGLALKQSVREAAEHAF